MAGTLVPEAKTLSQMALGFITEGQIATPSRQRGVAAFALAWCLVQAPSGCAPVAGPEGEGPGHRAQVLALTPEEELELGREAYREILEGADVLSPEDPAVGRVRGIGRRLVAATRIRPLLREINLHEEGDLFEWEFNVVESDRVNAFCLPGGKVAVFSGLLQFARSDDELATVLGHEMAHALAHHANERLALNPADARALRASAGRLEDLEGSRRASLIGLLDPGALSDRLLDPGAMLDRLSYNRFQEMEADHIGVFLMTFAGYDPEASLEFWGRMREASSGSFRLPEILSDHPADARRLAQLRVWVPLAEGGKRAYDRGEIASDAAR